MTIPAPFGPKYQERTVHGYSGNPCIICGRATGGKKNTLFGHVVGGGGSFARLDEDETTIDPAGDMGWFPVGSECAKTFPAGYLTKEG